MNFTGIDQITHGVEDLSECVRFYEDWGLTKVSVDDNVAVFKTMDGSEVVLCHTDDPALPPAIEEGSTMRHVVWGVKDEADLAVVREKISGQESYGEVDGCPACVDPNGLSVSFRVTQRHDVDVKGSPMNTWDQPDARLDLPSTFYEKAEPVKIGHVVFFVSDLAATEAFYTDVLGFAVSDRYPGAGTFLRCSTPGGHHSMFILETPDKKAGLNHVAYTVRDIHEVFGGGLQVDKCGWKTQIGPGRHPVSSAYFWYVENPAGALAEYFTDEDYCTDKWESRDFQRSNEAFTEWAVAGGIDFNTRRQRVPE
ncbi:MAG: glyoxalase [Rhodospirillaceae bacterium]|jgi:catechol 2,3-dioxygenase-like lactoylglutathione lyase family enzyme|nr:glyoxalase [Rhodospirillaceae bacterium]MBT4588494.1 glyoxalase [Rhodospirillaceae bacterium]MBT4938203.1 glyoxalase [Rhodospirillaceae bacterium]MBT7266384.1 glyoxalase [Rhodospirillaceae bacterium]